MALVPCTSTPIPMKALPLSTLSICTALLLGSACHSPSPGADEPVHRFVEDDGRQIHYVDLGSGERALVLIHGWACTTDAWDHQMRLGMSGLADLGRLIAIDLPGHGMSEPPAGDFSMRGFADAVICVLDDASVDRGVFIGHSNGVPVIRNIYAAYPERTSGLVAIDGTLKQLFDLDALDGMIEPFAGEDYQEAIANMIDGMPHQGLAARDQATIKAMAIGTAQEAVLGGFYAAADPEAYGEIQIDAPMLVLMTKSPYWNDEYRDYVLGIAPAADYRVIEGVGHFVQMERPDLLRAALVEFLGANDLP